MYKFYKCFESALRRPFTSAPCLLLSNRYPSGTGFIAEALPTGVATPENAAGPDDAKVNGTTTRPGRLIIASVVVPGAVVPGSVVLGSVVPGSCVAAGSSGKSRLSCDDPLIIGVAGAESMTG